jgi:pimeloyl-ACP methyl ester carboxylesterase
MMAGRKTLKLTVAALAFSLLSAGVAVAPAARADDGVEQWATSCNIPGLDYAKPQESDTAYAGGPVMVKPDKYGRHTPILMVHGFLGNSKQVDSGPQTGQFSKPIDLKTDESNMPPRTSFIGMLQDMGGTAVYTFDYHDHAARWVTDPRIGQNLSRAIECLNEKSDEKVIVIAHSMGGLATREALSVFQGMTDRVSQVIQFGTPNTGSDIAAVINGLPLLQDLSFPHIRLLLSICGRYTSSSLNAYDNMKFTTDDLTLSSVELMLCKGLSQSIATLRSGAGAALATGSSSLSNLASLPIGMPVHALSGDIQLLTPGAGYFFDDFALGSPSLGDQMVPLKSSQSKSTTQTKVTCHYNLYVLTPAAGMDSLMKRFGPLASTTRDVSELFMNEVAGAPRSPCFHGNLMRNIDLTSDALRFVVNDLLSRPDPAFKHRKPIDLKSARVPAMCGRPAGNLVNGSLPIPAGSYGATVTTYAINALEGDIGEVAGAVALNCNGGTSTSPDELLFYGWDGELLNSVNIGQLTKQTALVTEIRLLNNKAVVNWLTNGGQSNAAKKTIQKSGTFTWDGSAINFENLN